VIGGSGCGCCGRAWRGSAFFSALRAPVRLQEPPQYLDHPYLTTTTTRPPPAVGVSWTWTVSTLLLDSDSACCTCTDWPLSPRGRARASPSFPSPSRVDASRTPSYTPGATVYRVLIAVTSPLSPFPVACSLSRLAPLDRPSSIKRPFTTNTCHQTSIAGTFTSKSAHFVVDWSRVKSLYPTHQLAPTGALGLLQYCADHLPQLRPS
jgi:hypothetical protein